jgi:hypothetical protein
MPYRSLPDGKPPGAPPPVIRRRITVSLAWTLIAWGATVLLVHLGVRFESRLCFLLALPVSMVGAFNFTDTLWGSRSYQRRLGRLVPALLAAASLAFGVFAFYRRDSTSLGFAISLGMAALGSAVAPYMAWSQRSFNERSTARLVALGYVSCPRCKHLEPSPIDLARCHDCGKPVDVTGPRCICDPCMSERYVAHFEGRSPPS